MYKQLGKDGGINVRFGTNWDNSCALPLGLFWGKHEFSYKHPSGGFQSHWWFGINILCFYIEYNNERNAICLRDEENETLIEFPSTAAGYAIVTGPGSAPAESLLLDYKRLKATYEPEL